MIDLDRAIQGALNSHTLPGYYWFFRAITLLGNAYLWLAVLAGCILIGRWRKIASVLFILILFSMVINEDVKDIVQRHRPGDLRTRGYFSDYSYSFPSGHTQTAFAIATVLSAFIDRRYNVITYLLAAAVGVSRMYLGFHYFTDVIGGAAAGIAVGGMAIYGLYLYGLTGSKKARPAIDAIKNGLALLSIGFSIALFLLLAGQFVLSLASVLFVYLSLLSGAGFSRKNWEQ